MESQAKSRWLTAERCERESPKLWEAAQVTERPSLSRPLSLSWTDSLHTALLSFSWLLRQFTAQVWDKLRCWHCCRITLHCQQVSWTREIQGRSFDSKERKVVWVFGRSGLVLTTFSNIFISRIKQRETGKWNWRLSYSYTSFKSIFLMSRTKGQNVLTNEDAGFLQHWPIAFRLVPSLIRWVYDTVM